MNETAQNTAVENLGVRVRFQKWLTPHKLAAMVFFVLFLGADISLYLFGKSATGSVIVALILTLLSGVGALLWKRQRDHKDSNETQRGIALGMIALHATTAVIFMGGNFAKGGWEALADNILINGTLAKELMDYQVLIEKVFTWSIVITLAADLICLFWFMEEDTEKKQERVLAQIARDNKDAQLAAQKKTSEIARDEYTKYSESFSELQGLVYARDQLVAEYQNKLDADTLQKMLAATNLRIAELTGAIAIPANTSQPADFPQPPQTR